MKFGYTIVYTDDVTQSIAFFEQAFGLKRRFIHENVYGELETGSTALAFAAHELGQGNLPDGYVRADGSKPLGIEIALVADDVDAAFARAVAAGATVLSEPRQKPWGQRVAYVRCLDGTLVELCSAMAGADPEA